MNALIIGGNGFIGSHLTDLLLQEGHHVRIFDKYNERYRKPLRDVEYRIADFGNRGLLAEALTGVDTVYHLLHTSVPKTSNDDPVFDIQSNVIQTITCLELCVKSKINKIVYVSSGGAVYGNSLSLPISEDTATEPLCSYGITKLTIEKYLALFHIVHGLDYTIVRPANPYGPRQNPQVGLGFIAVNLFKALKGDAINIWGDGSIVKDFCYVVDLVKGISSAGQISTAHKIFNISSGTGTSLNEILSIMRDVTGLELNVCYLPQRDFDPTTTYLDVSRARKELGWNPTTSLVDGIKATYEFVKTLA